MPLPNGRNRCALGFFLLAAERTIIQLAIAVTVAGISWAKVTCVTGCWLVAPRAA